MSRTSVELQPVVTYPASVALPTPSVRSTQPASRQSFQSDDEGQTITGVESVHFPDVSRGKTAIIITSVTCITGISSLLAGVVGVTVPTMAKDLGLPNSLLLWPASIYALTCGCTLLLSGAIADVVGCRIMYLIGCILQSAFTLACGLSQNGMQLIVFRAFAGVAISFCLPSAVSIITNTFPSGKRRNIAFASMGGGQPIGFSIGLTIGGVFADTVGWRWGFHMAAILNTVIFVMALWGLPKDIDNQSPITLQRLTLDIDWIGALLASASLAMFSYVFASITGNTSNIRSPADLTLLCLAVFLVPAFIYWVGRQERLGRPAIIPNSLWRNRVFTSICLIVFLTWGTFNAIENILTFFFQYVQELSAIDSSLRFLPAPVAGALANVIIGLVVHRVRADAAILVATSISCISPLLMAVTQPQWSYWAGAFPPVLLNPVGADTLFTISNLLITSVFPARTQGLAGGVFNTVAQIGKSVGLATSAVIAGSVTARSAYADKDSPEALLEGYRAAWWYCFGLSVLTIGIAAWGLRRIGKVGVKRD